MCFKMKENELNINNPDIKYSTARLKFWGVLSTCWILIYPVTAVTDPLLSWVFFIIYAIGCIGISLIRCENCGVLLYRYNSTSHGMPDIRTLKPVPKCPNCGIKRL
jgi:DNA-directed RNA polymerase subunit RPC12/RpoP|tara:strand:- start:741 stop:1058 length:318 start_codon:yes stop_codon:yes gene_type:complete